MFAFIEATMKRSITRQLENNMKREKREKEWISNCINEISCNNATSFEKREKKRARALALNRVIVSSWMRMSELKTIAYLTWAY